MRNYLFYLAFILALAQMNAQTVIWSDDFEDEDVSDWAIYDEDGDGFNWADYFVVRNTAGIPVSPISLISRSWQINALTPNNWIVSPAVDLSSASGAITLKWKVQAAAAAWDQEHYSVYVATNSSLTSLQASSVSFSETYDDPVNAGSQYSRELDLSSFAGQVVYVAFRHHDCTDNDWLSIDDVSVEAEFVGGDPGSENCDLEAELADPDLGGPVWDRPYADGTGLSLSGQGVSYHIYGPFTVDGNGNYTFSSMQDGWDGMIFIYKDSFNPNDQLTNYVAGNDDSWEGADSQVTASLVTGTEYFLITTAYSSDEFGSFNNTITGPGDVTCGENGGEPGGPCDEKVIIECGETYTATLIPEAGEWVNYPDVIYNYPGSEQVFEFTAPVTGTYVFEVDEGAWDADFFLMDACSNTANNLIGGYWVGYGGGESIALTEGTTYYLVADLYSSSSTTVTVKVNCPENPDTGEDCSQEFTGAPNTGIGTINNGTAHYRGANDFIVEANTSFTLETISIDFLTDGTYTPNTADIYFYEDNSGPGALKGSLTGLTTNPIPNGALAGFTRYTLEITLPTPETFEGGDEGAGYWIGLTVPAPAGSNVAYWVSSVYADNGTDSMYQSADGGATWAPVINGASQQLEGVFTVSGVCQEDGEGGEYCEPVIDCTDGDVIYNVTFAGIDNDSGCSPNGYGDYTTSVAPANVQAGGTYNMSVMVGDGWYERVSLWIDFGNDGSFDAEDFLGEIGDGGVGVTLEEDITIPAGVAEGQYRMRIFVYAAGSEEPASEDPCINNPDNYGEYEDYLINVGAGSGGGEDCDQGDDSNDFDAAYQIGSGTDFENADDFYVSADNTLNVQMIELTVVSAFGPVESIGFTFYADDSGSPGTTVVESVTGLVPDEQVLIDYAFGGYEVYAIYVTVDLNFDGGDSGAHYWMQPMAVAPGGEIGGYWWEMTSVGELGAPVHTREAGGDWEEDPDGYNAVFKLYCTPVDPPDPPCLFDIILDIEPITTVDFADIYNVSDAAVNGSPALEDFTSIEGHIVAGETYDIALEGNTAGDYTNYFTVFIDWNQNGDLTDDGEMYEIGSITNSTGTDGQQATGSIMIPSDATEGPRLMRVIKNYNESPLSPCGVYYFGQAEDYTIIIGESTVEECSQEFIGDIHNGVGFINNGTQHYRAANDINVTGGTSFTLETISFEVVSLSGAPTTFDIYLYNDATGPGAELESYLGVSPTITPNGTFGVNEYPKFTVEYTLSAPYTFNAPAGDAKFWIGITGYPSVDAMNVYWVSSQYATNPNSMPTYQSDTAGDSWFLFVDTNGFNSEGLMTVSGYCGELGVSDMSSSYDFSYYPNPVKDELNITSQKAVQSVSIYNLAGQQVASHKMNASQGKVSTSALAPGVYVFRVVLDGGQVETFKIIKK